MNYVLAVSADAPWSSATAPTLHKHLSTVTDWFLGQAENRAHSFYLLSSFPKQRPAPLQNFGKYWRGNSPLCSPSATGISNNFLPSLQMSSPVSACHVLAMHLSHKAKYQRVISRILEEVRSLFKSDRLTCNDSRKLTKTFKPFLKGCFLTVWATATKKKNSPLVMHKNSEN